MRAASPDRPHEMSVDSTPDQTTGDGSNTEALPRRKRATLVDHSIRYGFLGLLLGLIVLLVGLQMGLGLFVEPSDVFLFAPGVSD